MYVYVYVYGYVQRLVGKVEIEMAGVCVQLGELDPPAQYYFYSYGCTVAIRGVFRSQGSLSLSC